MSRLLRRSALRHARRHPWQTWLTVLGIALGVGVLVAVDLANESARRASLLSAEILTGKATHRIVSVAGGIPEDFYRTLRIDRGLRRCAPVVEGTVSREGEWLQLIGIDPLAEGPFRQLGTWRQAAPEARAGGGLESDIARALIAEPGTALLSRITARRLGIGRGDRMRIELPGRSAELRIVGLLEGDSPALLEGLLVVDISTAQELLGRSGRLDRIDLILDPQQVEPLSASLPPGLRLEVPASRTRVMDQMIEAFQTNLAAMSLLAMLVGAFLIYNTMTFSVLRRRRLLGTLRILGVTRRALFDALLLEALLLGVVGTALGLLLGVVSAHYLIHLVTRTINDLYFVLTVTQLLVAPSVLLKAVGVGLGVTLLAALIPAVEAAAAVPVNTLRRSRLESRVHRGLPWLGLAGGIALLSGWLLVGQAQYGLSAGFVGLFFVIAGYSLLVPLGVLGLSRLAAPLAERGGLLSRLALRGIDANLSRTGLAIAALSLAVAATLGVDIMITSFRATVADWLAYTLRSDVYVSAPSGHSNRVLGRLPAGVVERIETLPEVAEIGTGRRKTVSSQYGPVDLLAIEMASGTYKGFRFLEPPLEQVWPRFRRGEVVLISEPYAYHHRLKTGDRLRLDSAEGPLALPVGGVFYDYGSERGLLGLARSAYARWWHDRDISAVGITLAPDTTPEAAIEAIRKRLKELDTALSIRSNREIREHSMAVFDRTFTITRVLRLLAVGVAFAGVLSALMALQLERAREQAVLRATGVTPAQLSTLIGWQTGLMGLYAGLFALPLGWIMSQALMQVINRRAFGWSILTQVPPAALVEALALALGAALLAGLYPAWRMGRVAPARALREE